MEVNNLNEVAILIDADFLSKLLINNYGFYRDLYPWKSIPNVNMLRLIDMIACNGNVIEKGSKVDVIFYYNIVHPVMPFVSKYGDLSKFLDFTMHDYHFNTDNADFHIRSYFSDPEIKCNDKNDFEREYMEGFRLLLRHIASTKTIRQVVLFADSEYLNDDLELYMESNGLLFLIERDNSNESHYQLNPQDVGKYYFVDANYVLALAMGLSMGEL